MSMCLYFFLPIPFSYDLCSSQAGWLSEQPKQDLDDWENPTGRVKTREFFMKYNVSVAGSKFKPSSNKWLGILLVAWKLHVASMWTILNIPSPVGLGFRKLLMNQTSLEGTRVYWNQFLFHVGWQLGADQLQCLGPCWAHCRSPCSIQVLP